MFVLSDFAIGSSNRWFYLRDRRTGKTVRRFNAHNTTLREVHLYREGLVKGLNDSDEVWESHVRHEAHNDGFSEGYFVRDKEADAQRV
jgi:hypothetical protein